MTVGVVYIDEGKSSLIQVTIAWISDLGLLRGAGDVNRSRAVRSPSGVRRLPGPRRRGGRPLADAVVHCPGNSEPPEPPGLRPGGSHLERVREQPPSRSASDADGRDQVLRRRARPGGFCWGFCHGRPATRGRSRPFWRCPPSGRLRAYMGSAVGAARTGHTGCRRAAWWRPPGGAGRTGLVRRPSQASCVFA